MSTLIELPIEQILLFGLLLIITGSFLPKIIWKLFSFDKKVQKIKSQTKSSEVRTGKIAESLAPLTDQFPVKIDETGSTLSFLGNPIDYIHFAPDGSVTFIEVKSGNAKLNKAQRQIRNAITNGDVYWKEVKIK